MASSESGSKSKNAASGIGKTQGQKGGRKGGKIFPRIDLQQALDYSKKVVSKTAVAPQDEATLLAGVFKNAGPLGKVRLSALKQFGLLVGASAAHNASPLAKEIETAVTELERKPLLTRALLNPKIYIQLFNTFQGDTASKSRIKSRAQQLEVHPDFSESCADLFIASALTAGLAESTDDGIRLIPATPAVEAILPEAESPENPGDQDEVARGVGQPLTSATGNKPPVIPPDLRGDEHDERKSPPPRPRMAADVKVNFTLDSSLDTDKLEKQLALLRSYGVI